MAAKMASTFNFLDVAALQNIQIIIFVTEYIELVEYWFYCNCISIYAFKKLIKFKMDANLAATKVTITWTTCLLML